jgi:phage terminase small subunit
MEGVIKRPPKTLKERKFVKEYAKDGNGTRAASEVYDVSNNNSAAVIASQNLSRLNIYDVLDRAGVTDDKIAETIGEGMQANKPISAVGGRDASEASVDFIDVPDWPSRLKATELASKMKGHLKDRVDLTSGDIPFPIYGGKSKA